jgi:hypothetical protein
VSIGKCKNCGFQAGFFGLEKGICFSCTEKSIRMDLVVLSENAIGDLLERWIEYNEMFIFKKDVPLSEIINSYSQVAITPFENKYSQLLLNPITKQQNTKLFLNLVCAAVLKSETHSKGEVNIAHKEILNGYIGKCDICENSVVFFNIKKGLCKQCREDSNAIAW